MSGVIFLVFMSHFHGLELKARRVTVQQGEALCTWLGAWGESSQGVTTGPDICAGCRLYLLLSVVFSIVNP